MKPNAPFHFIVDEAYAKTHNEMVRNTKNLVISGVILFVICVFAGIAAWFLIDPTSPWRILASAGLIIFGIMMLIVAFAIPKATPSTQSLYDAHPLAPAIITEDKGTTLTLTALVNTTVDPQRPPRWAITSRVVQRIPNTQRTTGTKVPVAAVGAQRSTSDKEHWQLITPMPIAWATPSEETLKQARQAIPSEQWNALEKAVRDTTLVEAAKNGLQSING